MCKVVKWAASGLWLVVDDDEEEHVLDKDQMEDALERLAEHAEFGSSDENGDDEDELEWQHTGHLWLNRYVLRDYGADQGTNQGTITKWVPADPKNPEEDPALWHVVFDDGDQEDLEAEEVEEALQLYAVRGSRKRGAQAEEQSSPERPRKRSQRLSSSEEEESERGSETESDDDDDMPSVTLSGRVRQAPSRFEAGPAKNRG
eukprot:TRINITY_DN40062_c0_g1_i1.p1 TRINITY_DN40062_c0_g1~~TRINITY_DN40062_c0_g1_i1.p1  ORF type:complete len:203 (+),score=69.54 TRINITY_DN40062_c0_g1_i1:137-745(+)